MRSVAVFLAVLLGAAALCGAMNGLAWAAADYAQTGVGPGERGFWALGSGFMGLLGGSLGMAEGLLIVPIAALLRARPTGAALAGAGISGGLWLLLGLGSGGLGALLAALLLLGGSALGWGTARLLRGAS